MRTCTPCWSRTHGKSSRNRAPTDLGHPANGLVRWQTSPRQIRSPRSALRTVWYPWPVEIILNIPDELARQVASEGKDPARVALEALALEGYRTERMSESAVRRMLGFDTRIVVHAFLKQHGGYLHYDLADLEQDQVTAEKLRARLQIERASRKPRLG